MKWKIKVETPKTGDIRTRRIFAWRKTKVGKYWIWLETYEVKEKYFSNSNGQAWWTEISREPLFFYPC